jgi:methionyl aminopeptidase
MVTIKRADEIERMRHAGRILAEILDVLHHELRPGITTMDLDRIAEEMIRDADAVPSFLGYHGTYPASICTSINDEVVHGIPSPRRRVEEADVIGIDIGCIWQGWHADCARTWSVGPAPASPRVQQLMDATRRGMEAGIAAAVPGNRLGDVGAAIEAVAREHGYGVVRPFVGHGIGTEMHEEPSVPNYGTPGRGMLIQAGMCFAIEPMFTLGGGDVEVLDDNWTVVTADGSLAAHFENTIAVTEHGPDVLTIR